MKKLLLIAAIAATSGLFGQVSIGIHIGPPPAPRVYRVRPVAPGEGYVWIDGYWYAEGGRYRWHNGYWTRPPHVGATWIAPRYDGEQFFMGYWQTPEGRFDHDHRWDRDHDRDYDRRR